MHVQAALNTYTEVRRTGTHNYACARIPLCTKLNIQAWRDLTRGHEDTLLCEMLEFGFPLGFEPVSVPTPTWTNHQSAQAFPRDVHRFLDTEVGHGTLLGPFKDPPFHPWTQISPLMTRPKRGSTERRVIVDLSCPEGASVNTFTPRELYCGEPRKLELPSARTLQQAISEYGGECYLYSCDISRAYRNLPLDPLAWPLCCIQYEGHVFIDTALSFGARWSAAGCQRVTDGVKYIMKNRGHTVYNYIDDICGIARTEQEALAGFNALRSTLATLGLPEAQAKACPPSRAIIWLGIQFDTVSGLMSIPHDKVEEIKALVRTWFTVRSTTLKKLQSLLGKLLHVAQCSHPARLFLNRMLATLRHHAGAHRVWLDDDFRRDLHWFEAHLSQENGTYMLPLPPHAGTTLECDSSLTGGGAIWGTHCHSTIYPEFVLNQRLSICHLEALNCLVSVKLWAPLMRDSTVHLLCDSIVTIHVLTSAKGRDPFLLRCAREMWLVSARYNIHIIPAHVPGTTMSGRADALSRRHLSPTYENLCATLIKHESLASDTVDSYMFKMTETL
jgi:hypothetical protein